MGVSRRKFLKTALRAAAALGIPLTTYAGLIEPNRVSLEHVELPVSNLPQAFDGFRIVQLSDLHYGPYTGEREIGAAVQMAESLKPDMFALTGDFITSGAGSGDVATNMAICARLLSTLKAPHGVFACLGNHDVLWSPEHVIDALNAFGIQVVRNSNVKLEKSGERLWVAGVDDEVIGQARYGRALAGIPRTEPVLLLAHEPDLADRSAAYNNIIAQLSGHSHGGQVRLPLIGCPFLPRLAVKYPYGYYRIGDMHLYTNRGIGTILLPFRFHATPEVTLVTLHKVKV